MQNNIQKPSLVSNGILKKLKVVYLMKLVYRAATNYARIVALVERLQHDLETTCVINFLWENKIKKRTTKGSILPFTFQQPKKKDTAEKYIEHETRAN